MFLTSLNPSFNNWRKRFLNERPPCQLTSEATETAIEIKTKLNWKIKLEYLSKLIKRDVTKNKADQIKASFFPLDETIPQVCDSYSCFLKKRNGKDN